MFYDLYDILEFNNVLAFELNSDHKNHNLWRNFDSETFIFSVIRDPISRTISDFCYWANYGDNGIRTHNKGRDSECPFYTKENMLYWLESKHIENYQSKIISNNNFDFLEKNMSRINMLLRAEEIQNNENLIGGKILKHFNISHNFKYYPPDFEPFFMPPDGSVNDIIINNKEIIEIIKEKNQKDLWLYNQASSIFSDNSLNTEE